MITDRSLLDDMSSDENLNEAQIQIEIDIFAHLTKDKK